ncbi:hypothetical protein ACJJIP_19880 [Microbulbifer sp. VTAC004]|uniref:hypothetical protein n=1 Tax=Microbulbifer sp. VTAC004 TaxID=3243386 RepID=UPI00403A64DF
MGVVLGISLFNEGDKFYREQAQVEGLPVAKAVTIEDLHLVLIRCIEEGGHNYRVRRLESGELEIAELLEDCEPYRVDAFRYELRRKGDAIVIHSTYKDDALYFHLACRAASGQRVKIDFHGEHPFYNYDSIAEYQGGGNYHLANFFDLQYLPGYIEEHCRRFIRCLEYWSFTFFIPYLGKVELNNHTSDPEQPLYHLDFHCPERKLKIFQSATEREGSYYFRDAISAEKLVQLLEAMATELLPELQKADVTSCLSCFEAIHQAYSEIESTIETDESLASVAEDLIGYQQNIRGRPVQYEVTENADGSITVQAYYFQPPVGYNYTVSAEDIAGGHIYLDKLHDLDFYEQMCRAIARHLCPTMPTVEDLDEVTIYYHRDSDKKLIASLLEGSDITPILIQVK